MPRTVSRMAFVVSVFSPKVVFFCSCAVAVATLRSVEVFSYGTVSSNGWNKTIGDIV